MSYSSSRLHALRSELEKHNLDGFLVPQCDEYQGEYVADYAKRLKWLTGFSGSAGFALILRDKAIMFVDGRYSLQVRQQTDPDLYSYEDLFECPPAVWLRKHGANLKIGYDPMLHVVHDVQRLEESLSYHPGSALVPVEENLVDTIWLDQPARPLAPIYLHPIVYSGQSCEDKLTLIKSGLKDLGADFGIITDPSSVAWLLNIRGSDVEHTPIALGFAIVNQKGSSVFFLDDRKIPSDIKNILGPVCKFENPENLFPYLRSLVKEGQVALLDPSLCAYKFADEINKLGGRYVADMDLCRLPKACKNPTELEGAVKAHIWDGVAVTKFLYWLEQQPANSISEIGASDKLEQFRVEVAQKFNSVCEDQSFATISGAGEHGAIIHYKSTEETNKILGEGELYLVDSGAQYKEGTTDITRTVAMGEIKDPEIKKLYTLVLKGAINISTARFPEGTRGVDLDTLARIALWKSGFNYAHGTGHGVGSFLAVHEGPQNISPRGMVPLRAGMIVSNEPGYYRDGAFGIRLENLIYIEEKSLPEGGELEMFSFKNLTYVPFAPQLIDASLLTAEELAWLNDYHSEVFSKLSPHLTNDEKNWLAELTKEIS